MGNGALPMRSGGGGSILGKLIGFTFFLIVIVAVLGIVGTSTVLSNVTNLVDGSQDVWEILLKGSVPIPKPVSGEMVCDLKITVFAKLDQFFPFTPYEVVLDPRIKNYHWSECHDATEFPLFALLDFGKNVNEAVTLGFFPTLIAEDFTIPAEIKLIDKDGTVIDSSHQRNLKRDILIRQGVSTPIDITETYAVKNIPLRNYELEIHFPDNKINGKNVGAHFTDEVCTFDTESFPCI